MESFAGKLANWQTGKLANWQTGKLANWPEENMETSKITIRLNRKSHIELKNLAMHRRITLNQLCLDLIHSGLGERHISTTVPAVGSTSSKEGKVDDEVEKLINHATALYVEKGLSAILKMDEYVADYVFIFGKEGVPGGVVGAFLPLVQGLQFPETNLAPSMMWIEISQKHKIVWSLNEEFKAQLVRKLDGWG